MPLGDSESGDDNLLTLYSIVECPNCGLEFDQTFKTEAQDIEQITDPPTAEVTCAQCSTEFTATFQGFTQYGYG
jgi:hypothetical protein